MATDNKEQSGAATLPARANNSAFQESKDSAEFKSDPGMEGSLTHVWIPVGATLFVVALTVSALAVPQLRLLHFLQALIYVAVVISARRGSMWGFGAGFTVAVVWNSLNMFVTHLMQAGAVTFWSFLRTGRVARLDTMMVTFGGVGHFVLMIACLAALLGRRDDNKKWRKFIGGGVAALAYFALIVAAARPR